MSHNREGEKGCLTCKYEPEWGGMSPGEYGNAKGSCKWEKEVGLPDDWCPVVPASYTPITTFNAIMSRYKDDLGLPYNCPTWAPKETCL